MTGDDQRGTATIVCLVLAKVRASLIASTARSVFGGFLKSLRFCNHLICLLSSPLRSAVSLRYAQRLLQKPETAIWIFPQGKLCRQNEPVELKPGTDFLAKNAPHALLVPVAMRYEFFREDRPNVLIEIGQPFAAIDRTEGRIAQECNEAFARVSRAAQDNDLTGFDPLFKPRWTINKRWQWVKLALTGRLREFSPTN